MLNFGKCVNEFVNFRKLLLNSSKQHFRNEYKITNNCQEKSKEDYSKKLIDSRSDGKLEVLKENGITRSYDYRGTSGYEVKKLRPVLVSNKRKFIIYGEQFFSLFKLKTPENNLLFQGCVIYNNLQLNCNYCTNLPKKICHPEGTVCPIQICKPPAVAKRRLDNTFSIWGLRFILLMVSLISSGTIYYILYTEWQRKLMEEKIKLTGDYQSRKGKQMRPQLKFERNPCCSEEIPDEVPYIMVGGGAATGSACSAIKKHEPDAKILILMNEPYRPYKRAPLSKIMIYYKDRELAKQFQYKDKFGALHSIFFEKEGFYIDPTKLEESENGGIACAYGWPVVKVDPVKKEITLDDGKRIKYTKKCLLATGASPNQLDMVKELPSDVLRQISYYGGLYDFKKLEEIIENGADSIAIFGGGFLGCELTSALAKRSKDTELKITHIIREECVMDGIIPKYVGKWLTNKIYSKGNITFINNTAILSIDLNKDGKLELALSGDRKVFCDHLLICIGSVANTDLARISGLEICKKTSAFVANPELQVRKDLYTAGDCGSFYDSFLDERINVRHHDYALYTGKLAGENMTGAVKSIEHQAIYFSEIGATMYYEVVGYTNPELPTVGIFAIKKENISNPPILPDDIDYSRGVIFYLKDDMIVGAVLWNVPNRLPMVRRIIFAKKHYQDLNTIAKMLELHND